MARILAASMPTSCLVGHRRPSTWVLFSRKKVIPLGEHLKRVAVNRR